MGAALQLCLQGLHLLPIISKVPSVPLVSSQFRVNEGQWSGMVKPQSCSCFEKIPTGFTPYPLQTFPRELFLEPKGVPQPVGFFS